MGMSRSAVSARCPERSLDFPRPKAGLDPQSCPSSACQRMVGSAGKRYEGVLISLRRRWATRAIAILQSFAAEVAGYLRLMGRPLADKMSVAEQQHDQIGFRRDDLR